MIEDPAPGFRAELQALLGVLQPQLRGLASISNDEMSDGAHDVITKMLTLRTIRKGLAMDIIHAMNVLLEKIELFKAAGGFELPPVEVNPDILSEVQDNLNNAVIAANLFGATASTVQDQAMIDKLDIGIKANNAALSEMAQPTP